MDFSAGFEKKNILNPHNAISQENTIITTKCGGCAILLQAGVGSRTATEK